MNLLGLSAIADSLVGGDDGERGISGGQRRRLNVGIELMGNPTILFCDEPTSGLDSSTSLELMTTLRRIAETSGMTRHSFVISCRRLRSTIINTYFDVVVFILIHLNTNNNPIFTNVQKL